MQLEEEVTALKVRLEHLEATVHRLVGSVPDVAGPGLAQPFDPAQLRAWLRAEGMISEPTLAEQTAAERWNALPVEEQQRLRLELERPAPGPMVSDIVIDQRR